MTVDDQELGGRLPLLDPASMSDAQRALYEQLQQSWVPFANSIGVKATASDGRLIGPFNFFLLHPEITAKLSDFQQAEQANSTLPQKVREIVIIVIGGIWNATYELYAQDAIAGQLGLTAEQRTVLAAGGIPEDLEDYGKIAARLANTLAMRHSVDDELYAAAEKAFGRIGLFDLLAVMGIYQTVCSGLALFKVPAPI